jgi:hypothetical protein
VGFAVDEVALGNISSEYIVSLSNVIPLNVPYLSAMKGWHNRHISDQCSLWTYSHRAPRLPAICVLNEIIRNN